MIRINNYFYAKAGSPCGNKEKNYLEKITDLLLLEGLPEPYEIYRNYDEVEGRLSIDNYVSNNLLKDYTIYPNPNDGMFTIVFSSKLRATPVIVLNDMFGNPVNFDKIITNNEIRMVIKDHQPGIFILCLSDNSTLIKKIIVCK